MSKWAQKYPHIGNCVDAVASIVQKLRSQPDAELEARFGVIRDRFVPGVSRAEIDRIIAMMQTSPYVSGQDEWIEEQDFLYTHDGRQFRTRVNYDSVTMQVVPHTIEKRLLGLQDIAIMDSAQQGCGHVRVALKSESSISRVQPCVQTTMVRIKQRRRFVTNCGMWAFDFALLWSGRTKTEAEQMQSTTDPLFEVECELIDAQKMLAMHDNERIAASLLLKVHDLVPSLDSSFRLVL